ncbi:MAG: hypothetical protein LC676_04955 [Loktanella sp.]|nr:hypothetical protein [Loktanella sp.]
MSFKLNQQPVAGESYVRCPQVVIDNRLGRTPVVTFHREQVIGLGGGNVQRYPLPPRPLPFDSAASVPVINPETGEPTGATITQGELYALVFSVFIAAETTLNEEEPLQ